MDYIILQKYIHQKNICKYIFHYNMFMQYSLNQSLKIDNFHNSLIDYSQVNNIPLLLEVDPLYDRFILFWVLF